jgi:metal-sulfur cluster biosynthetic enzyme
MDETRFTYDGPQELLPALVQSLETVVDPEVALNIVDVGLVHTVTIGDGRVDVRMTMTSSACPVTDIIVDDVEIVLQDAMPPGLAIRVELVWEPPWTPQRMSPRARAFMGW